MTPLGNDERKGRSWKLAATAGVTAMLLWMLSALITATGNSPASSYASGFIAGMMLLMYALALWVLWLEKGSEVEEVVPVEVEPKVEDIHIRGFVDCGEFVPGCVFKVGYFPCARPDKHPGAPIDRTGKWESCVGCPHDKAPTRHPRVEEGKR